MSFLPGNSLDIGTYTILSIVLWRLTSIREVMVLLFVALPLEWCCGLPGYSEGHTEPRHSMERICASFGAALRGISPNRCGAGIGFRGQEHS
jgi:hypothetical protein